MQQGLSKYLGSMDVAVGAELGIISMLTLSLFLNRFSDSKNTSRSRFQNGICDQCNLFYGLWAPQHADVPVPRLCRALWCHEANWRAETFGLPDENQFYWSFWRYDPVWWKWRLSRKVLLQFLLTKSTWVTITFYFGVFPFCLLRFLGQIWLRLTFQNEPSQTGTASCPVWPR